MCKNSFCFSLSFFKDKLHLLLPLQAFLDNTTPHLLPASATSLALNSIFQNVLILSHWEYLLKLKIPGPHLGKGPGEAAWFLITPADHQGNLRNSEYHRI